MQHNSVSASQHRPGRRHKPRGSVLRTSLSSLLWYLVVGCTLLPVAYVLGIRVSDTPTLLFRAASYGHDILVTLALLTAAFGFGSSLNARFLNPTDDFTALYAIAVGLGVLSLVILGLGLIGAFYIAFLMVPLAIGVALALLIPANRGLALDSIIRARSHLVDLRADGVTALVVIFSIGSDLYVLATNAMVPPIDWDTVAYHLAVPAIYVHYHGIVPVPYIVYSQWPFNLEMLYVPILMLGTERTAGFLNLAFFALGQLALLTAGKRYYSPRGGALAVAFYTSIPYVLSSVGTARVDVPLATWAFLGVLAFYRGLAEPGSRYLILAGLLGGFAAGSKYTAASTLVILGAFLLSYCVVRRPPGPVKLVLQFVIPAILVASPWYLKSWIVTGDPVWPFLPGVFPMRGWDAYGDTIFNTWLHSFGTGTSLQSLVTLPVHLFLDKTYDAPTGPLFLGLVPVALVTGRKWGLSMLLGGFSLISIVVWFVVTQQPRFLSAALLALSLLAGFGASRLLDTGPTVGRSLLSVVLVAWLVTQFPLVSGSQRLADSLPVIRGTESRSAFLQRHVDVWPVFDYANHTLPPDARVLLLYYEVRGFYLQRDYVWGNPVSQRLIRWEQIPDAASLDVELSRLGVTYIIITPQFYLPNAPYAQHMRELVSSYLHDYTTQVWSSNGDGLYRIVR